MNISNLNNSQLGYYLTGLIEGYGHILTFKILRSSSGRIYNPIIGLTFHRKEIPLFIRIK